MLKIAQIGLIDAQARSRLASRCVSALSLDPFHVLCSKQLFAALRRLAAGGFLERHQAPPACFQPNPLRGFPFVGLPLGGVLGGLLAGVVAVIRREIGMCPPVLIRRNNISARDACQYRCRNHWSDFDCSHVPIDSPGKISGGNSRNTLRL